MEKWKDIKKFRGLYQISNFGNIKSCKKTISFKKQYTTISYENKEKILKPLKTPNGYYHICLYSNGKRTRESIHRLVAETFIINEFNKPQVNHIDGNKRNNRLENLEWCTCKENTIHAFKNGLRVGKPTNTKMLNCYKNNKLLNTFNSQIECARWIIKQDLSKGHEKTIRRTISKSIKENKIRYGMTYKLI